MLRTLLARGWRFCRSEDGPTAVEYAIMIALIVLVCFASIGLVGTNANVPFQRTSQSLGGAG